MDTQLPEIVISCQGATTVNLDELADLQGNLKDLSEENYVKLRNSMTEFGFSFPIFFWQDETGKKWILDAHQRKRVLGKMKEEGYVIPPLPADPIFAKDKIEAKKKLLLLNSQYGKIDLAGYDAFIEEEGAVINEEEIGDLLAIPVLTLFEGGENQEEGQDEYTNLIKKLIVCPNCKHEFSLQKGGEENA